MLREKYLKFIQDHTPQFYNPNHQTFKLKNKLVSHFGNTIEFWQPHSRKSELVYSANVDIGEAVETAFEGATSESRLLEEAAMILRRHIISGQHNSTEMPWPPSANYLQSDATTPPEPLCTFVAESTHWSETCKILQQIRAPDTVHQRGYLLSNNPWKMEDAEALAVVYDFETPDRQC